MTSRIEARARAMVGLFRLPQSPEFLEGGANYHALFPAHDPRNAREYLFLSDSVFESDRRSRLRIDWRAESMPLLWCFHLHCFNYCPLFVRKEQEDSCRSLVHANSLGTVVSWRAYPTSLSIVNWCRAKLVKDLQERLYLRAAQFCRNLEICVYSKHLLDNVRSLTTGRSDIADHDNVTMGIQFDGGSVGTLCYNTVGDKAAPEERLEVYGSGTVATLDDFRVLEVVKDGRSARQKAMNQDKGQSRQIAATVAAFRERGEAPIPFDGLVDVMQAVFAARKAIASDQTTRLEKE